jgi:phosphomannomutase
MKFLSKVPGIVWFVVFFIAQVLVIDYYSPKKSDKSNTIQLQNESGEKLREAFTHEIKTVSSKLDSIKVVSDSINSASKALDKSFLKQYNKIYQLANEINENVKNYGDSSSSALLSRLRK